MGRLSHTVAALTLLAPSLAAKEAPAQPRASLQATNMNPLVQIYGLPRMTEGPKRPRAFRVSLGLDWASHAVSDASDKAVVQFDGETRRYTLKTVGPLAGSGGWWAVALPFVSHSGGQLDPLIASWHDSWGLPHGNRANRPRNELLYHVVDSSGRERLSQTRSASGPGDVALAMGAPLFESLSAGIRIEAPTGDPDKLLGSGGWDTAAWLALGDHLGAWSWHLAGGGLYIDDSTVLPDRHRTWAPVGRAALGWHPLEPFTVHAQLDSHGAMYDSEPTPIGRPALQLRLGAKWHAAQGFRAIAGFSEDLAVGTGPDITFHLRLSQDFGAHLAADAI